MTLTNKIAFRLAGAAFLVVVIYVASMKCGDSPPATRDDAGPPATTVETPATTTSPPLVMAPPSSAAPPPSINYVWPTQQPTDLGQAALEASKVSAAQQALDKGDYRTAVKLIEEWERLPERGVLTVQATMIKLEALPHVNRRADALALAMDTRSDDKFKDKHDEIEAIMQDAGLSKPPADVPMKP